MKTKRFRQSILTGRLPALLLIITLWLIALMMQPIVAFTTGGKLVYDKIHSPALEGNLLGDSATRNVTIYLPPGYDENPDERYPVIYLAHGFTGTNLLWTGSVYLGGGFNIKNIADSLMQQGQMKPIILVAPDARNRYLGNAYANSPVIGNWEDFFTRDLVKYIDETYRTLPQATSRGIAGHSSGGHQAMKFAMLHPEVYSATYVMSSGSLIFEDYINIGKADVLPALNFIDMNQFNSLTLRGQAVIALSAAVSPNPNNPPFFVDFPVDSQGQIVDSVWQRWLKHDPFTLIDSHQENLLQLQIRLDCGTSDSRISQNRTFSQALTDASIPHVFEEYPGTHTSGVRQRMEAKVLPFFSDVLAFEMLPVETNVQQRGKLVTTWGRIKHSR